MIIPDVPLPPSLRRLQQTWLWQVICLPILLGFGGAILVGGCLANGIDGISRGCVMGAISSTLVSFLTVIVSGHSVGSSSFHNDGSENKAVGRVTDITKAIPGDAADTIKVVVEK